MKVLFIFGLILAGAFIVKAGEELCGLDHDQIKQIFTCMGERVSSELKGKASEIIHSKGDNLAELLKKECAHEVEADELLKEAFNEEETAAIKEAYEQCKPDHS